MSRFGGDSSPLCCEGIAMTDDKARMFADRYAANDIPWDSGITPPEIVEIVAELPPGKALDLGCGTGTNVRYLLEHGWEADGIDFVSQAVELAHAKLADFPPEQFTVLCYDVTQLAQCEGLRQPYDLVVDIGCGHGIPVDKQVQYAADVAALLRPGGILMLYAIQPTEDRDVGWTPMDVQRIFTPYFDLVWQAINDDTATSRPAGWYRLVRSAPRP